MANLFTIHAASLDDPARFRPQVVTYHAAAQGLLHADRPRRSDGQSDPQGRITPVRAGVLPPLPARRPLTAIPGHRDHSYRVPVRGGSEVPLKKFVYLSLCA